MGRLAAHNPAADPERKRLHITPFNADLLDRYVPPSLRPLASNISFHTIQAFPERGFGYIELPAMEADKLKKKLNGSTLKSVKVRIEDAKRAEKRAGEREDDGANIAIKRAKKEKRKREQGVIAGHELEEGRHVKRGWAEDGAEQKLKKNKKRKLQNDAGEHGLEKKTMLFKAIMPPSSSPLETKTKSKSKEKKTKKDLGSKRKTVVQEFAKSKKPATSIDGSLKSKRVSVYEDDKGWVDEDGNVVEPPPRSNRPKTVPPADESEVAETVLPSPSSEAASASSPPPVAPRDTAAIVDASESDDIGKAESTDGSGSELEANTAVDNGPGETIASDSIQDATQEPKEVHPLEALFKRPVSNIDSDAKLKPQPIDTSFSFFNSGSAEDEDEDKVGDLPPHTPHTKQDLEWRGIRSAAPTPETAANGNKFSFPLALSEDDDEEGSADDAVVGSSPTGTQGEREESEFRKWFYDNRGDLNRSWKRRRRDERKQKRQRENRRLSRRVA